MHIFPLLIPREILRLNPRTRQIRQSALPQIQLEEIPHQRLNRIFSFILHLVDSALKPL
jgi:hypothetical protein